TGLHYNRYRYYDPRVGRFVSQDPISYTGGLNLFAYAPNPVQWTDALGLGRSLCDRMKKGDPDGKGNFRGGSYGGTTTRGVESHHMPADSVSPIKRSQGPAIQMDPSDHARTSSHGRQGNAGKAYRAEIQQMINSENMRGTMAMEIRDVRRVASESGQPRKYNVAMQEVLAYSKCQGYWVKK
uniref:RHS repeat-associated core domain-containing protein n=1 Tax=Pseudomonas sp. KCJK9044 TaxID=3344562 RepID=UPI0039062BBC